MNKDWGVSETSVLYRLFGKLNASYEKTKFSPNKRFARIYLRLFVLLSSSTSGHVHGDMLRKHPWQPHPVMSLTSGGKHNNISDTIDELFLFMALQLEFPMHLVPIK
jgi:hypothetical protein